VSFGVRRGLERTFPPRSAALAPARRSASRNSSPVWEDVASAALLVGLFAGAAVAEKHGPAVTRKLEEAVPGLMNRIRKIQKFMAEAQ
jgi:hypothetical protein